MSSEGNGVLKPLRKPLPIPKKFPTTFNRCCYKFYAAVDNRLWPVRPIYFVAGAATLGAIQAKFEAIPLLNVMPVFANRVAEICRKLLSLSPPLLKSCDNLLPSPSVPDLDETVGKYLKSVENILRKDEFDLVKEHAQSFLKNEGRRLHMYAWIMSMMSDNYITPFWEKYAYLYSREPLLINSSVAHTDLMEIPEHRRATRAFMAARVTYFESLSQLAIDRQAIPPLGNGLLCACHYDKLYSVCRVPGEKVDELVNYGISKYVVAILNGCFYKVMICDENNRIYSINELAKIYAELFSRNDTIDGPSAMVAALTTDRRDGWARNREKFFLKHPKNAATLREIESAAFILTLDDYEYYIDPENPDKLSNFLHNMLTGNGVNRWADKSLSYVVSKNSRCGGTTEHSIGDGSEFDHIMENFVSMELLTEYPSLEDQQRIEKLTDADKNLTLATRLPVEVSDEMGMEIQRCYSQFEKLRMDVDLAASLFRKYGKGFIKKCGVSPDAFMQMAIQLANYRDQGRFVLTYEPASARFYRNSRTETLRTVTDQSCEFVYAMVNGKASNEEKIERLRVACELHSKRNREAMVPVVTNQVDEDKEKWRTWSGACFGAVAKDGYGICYRFGGNHSIIAHITSYKSAENTNSSRFRGQLETALQEMAALFGGAN
ncbi:hypothetical protein NECAME_00372 [Necator americanus]|uniref:Choline/carnitine acyltransferase domain-containing protein n=1 Tax=Necator americanus TaxID=51031 RepID=W2TAW4_NECAM|nr:hypothetical protein NECAME_00372 [Necator americanus]ETN78998.1 hypothetical protein NECAME_00372 [Necator americanus]